MDMIYVPTRVSPACHRSGQSGMNCQSDTSAARALRTGGAVRLDAPGRLLRVMLVLWGVVGGSAVALAESFEPADPETLADAPITTASGEVGQLLRRWHAAGTAAGNVGDYYDNRDRGHSAINRDHFPQLGRIVYSEQDREQRRDWGFADRVRKPVVVGNSSTAAPVTRGGSHGRNIYTNPRLLGGYFMQYLRSDLFVYPEHRDYDPGRHGLGGGFGDLYPFNTPYLLISRGSSGSDRKFVNAALWTLAALRPEVKEKLRENHLLMPTLQLIFRQSQKGIQGESDYLTGRAHPTAFDGDKVDPMRMVKMAHGITADRLPPLAVLKVVEESPSTAGVDYFHERQPERFVDTPAAVARVFRGIRPEYTITLSAEGSGDVNNRPLSWKWVVLRGDAEAIDIEPLNAANNRVRITVPWRNEPMTAPGDAKIEHRRVDIACFVDNGAYHSPPAFFTLYFPDNQGRTIRDGRVLEVGYGAQRSPLGGPNDPPVIGNEALVRDWAKLLDHLSSDDPRAAMLRDAIDPADRNYLEDLTDRFEAAEARVANRRQVHQQASEELKKARKAGEEARVQRLAAMRKEAARQRNRAERELEQVITARDSQTGRSADQIIKRMYATVRNDPMFFLEHQRKLESLNLSRANREVDRLAGLNILIRNAGQWALNPLLPGDGPASQRLGDYQRDQLGRLNDWLIHELAAGATWRPRTNYVDPRIVLEPDWRDVYHYDDAGQLIGWTRHSPEHDQPLRFNAQGKHIRDGEAVGVGYEAAGSFPDLQLRMILDGQ